MGMVNQRTQMVSAQANPSPSAEPENCRVCGEPLPDQEPLILFGRTFKIRPTVCARCEEHSKDRQNLLDGSGSVRMSTNVPMSSASSTRLGTGATIRPGSSPRSPGNTVLGDSSSPVPLEQENPGLC